MSGLSQNTNFTNPGYDGAQPNVGNLLTYNQAIAKNYNQINSNLQSYYKQRSILQENGIPDIHKKYDYQGKTLVLPGNKTPTIMDALQEDNHSLLLQENTTYIVGTMTMATFLVLALIIGSQ
jgi:hypothetical protein